MTEIEKDLRTIHEITDKELFPLGISYFEKKWKTSYPDFIAYFKSQWVENMPGWYLGFVEGSPSTNNGAEGKNGTIKKYHTKYVKNGFPAVGYM